MARVTVEDCVLKVPNRFDLILMAAHRARQVSSGTPAAVERDNDKNPVVSLREIAAGAVEVEELDSLLIQGLQRHVEVDEPEDDDFDSLSVEASAEIGSMIIVDDVDEDQMIGVQEEAPGASAFILDDEDDLPPVASGESEQIF